MIAGTVVVNTKSALTVADTVFMEIEKTGYKVMFPDVMRLSDRDINTIKGVLTQANKTNNYGHYNTLLHQCGGYRKIEHHLAEASKI